MNIKKMSSVIMIVCLLLISQPLSVFADRCDDKVDEAKQVFLSARDAFEQGDYAQAIELSEEAEELYTEASEMRNCRCPKIEKSSKKNIRISRKNTAIYRRALENQDNYEAELGVVDQYNQAIVLYNEGNSFARNGQYEDAVSSFEEAEMVFNSIASEETENGRRAMKMAEQSNNLAEMARERF